MTEEQQTNPSNPPVPNYTREPVDSLNQNNSLTLKTPLCDNPTHQTNPTNIDTETNPLTHPANNTDTNPPNDDGTALPADLDDSLTKREYLQGKITQMDTSIINAASHAINDTNKSIEDDIKNDKIKITEISAQIEQLNSSLKHPLQLSTTLQNDQLPLLTKPIPYELDRKRKAILKNLTQSKTKLELEIHQLQNEENLLKNRAFVNLSINGINASTEVDENINRDKLKHIQFKKESIQGKLNEINRQLTSIYDKEKQDKTSKSEIIRNFILNFEHDKIIAEELLAERLHKIDKHVYYDKYKYHENKAKLLDEELQRKLKTEENEQRVRALKEQELKRKQFKEQQRERVLRMKNETKKKMGDAPSQRFEVVHKKQFKNATEINAYLYEQNENRIIEKEKAARKEQMKQITADEINQFKQQVDLTLNKNKLEYEQRSFQLKELWKERKQLLPKFSSSAFEYIKNNDDKAQVEQKEKEKIDMKIMAIQKNVYAKNIQKKYLPHIDPKLKNELDTRIHMLNNPRKYINKISKSSYGSRHRRGRIILKKLNPNSFKWELKLHKNQSECNTLPNANGVNANKQSNAVIKKQPLDKPIDYLREARMKRNSEGASKEKDNKVNYYDWEKMIHDDKKDINENIANVKLKAENLQKQAERKAQLLKYTNTEHTELGDEVGELYINSIQAKLQILNAMTNPNNDNDKGDYSDVEED